MQLSLVQWLCHLHLERANVYMEIRKFSSPYIMGFKKFINIYYHPNKKVPFTFPLSFSLLISTLSTCQPAPKPALSWPIRIFLILLPTSSSSSTNRSTAPFLNFPLLSALFLHRSVFCVCISSP